VWVSEKLVWKAAKEVSGQQLELIVAEGNESDRRNWLYSIVRALSEKDAVCGAMMKEGYYQLPVTVITGRGRPLAGFYIPFLCRAFGIEASELERRKGRQIRAMIRSIIPKRV
jgi:hypothetical protein